MHRTTVEYLTFHVFEGEQDRFNEFEILQGQIFARWYGREPVNAQAWWTADFKLLQSVVRLNKFLERQPVGFEASRIVRQEIELLWRCYHNAIIEDTEQERRVAHVL